MSNINPDFEWLYPDLLRKEDLIKSLKKRFIHKDDLNKLGKQELVDLYHKYIIPLPQRKYRQNRRGRQMTKQQVLLVKKRRHSTPDDRSEPPQKKQSSGSGLVTSFEHLKGSSGDRLKPPPSCVNYDKKTVKLGSTVSASPKLTSKLDKLSLSKNKSSSDPNSDSPEKKVKLNDFVKKDSENLKSKTIKLINKQIERHNESEKNEKSEELQNQSGEKSHNKSTQEVEKDAESPTAMDTSEPAEKEKKKIKITKISWP